MKEHGPVLVLAAAPIEIAALEELVAERGSAPLEIRVVGVGKVAAALGAERALAELSPSWVLQLGCAGAKS